MKNVTVKVADLQAILTKNHAQHRELFLKAAERYREQLIGQLNRYVDALKRGKTVNVYITLPVPRDYSAEYNRALKMLEMHTEPTVEITKEDFGKLVMDDWDWKREFSSTVSNYVAMPESDTVD